MRGTEKFIEAHKNIGNYTTLGKALEEKKLTISETGANGESATVNTLKVENTSSDSIMLLTGEVVKGGRQDRMIAQDLIIPPHSGKMDLPVFCVEHGRWSYRGARDNDALVNHADVSMKEACFMQCVTVVTASARKKAAVEKSQQGVWDKVAETTVKADAQTSTGTYTAVTDSSSGIAKDLKEYSGYFKKALLGQDNVVGVIICTGDKIIGADLFATPALFREHTENLLASYVTEAVTNGTAAKTEYKLADSYLKGMVSTDEETQEKELGKKGTLLKVRGKRVHCACF